MCLYVCVVVDSELCTDSTTTSTPATDELPEECYVCHPPMTRQCAAEARGVNMLMREPHLATSASELLDYAGWIHPLAAADVLAGETTEKRRCVEEAVFAVYTIQALIICAVVCARALQVHVSPAILCGCQRQASQAIRKAALHSRCNNCHCLESE